MSSLLTAAVELKPDLAKFKKEVAQGTADATKDAARKLEQGLGQAGGAAGKRAGDAAGKGIADGVTDGARRGGKQAEDELGAAGQRAASKFSSGWDRLNSIGNKMTLGITLPAVAAAKLSLDAFSKYQDASSAAGVFYGEQARQIEAFAKRAATGYGMSRVAVLELANGLNPLISQFAAADQQGTTAVEAMKRVGDMASFFGGSVQEAAGAVQSFLSGSSVEPIRRYGVFASEAAVQAKALAMGLVQANVSSAQLEAAQVRLSEAQTKAREAARKYGAGSDEARKAVAGVGLAEEALARVTEGKIPMLTEQQKIQARYALLMEQTAKAEGDFQRTSDSLANTQKTATAQMQNAAITLGQKLAPSMIKVLRALTGLVKWFNHLSPTVQNAILIMAGVAVVAGPLLKLAGLVRTLIGLYNALRASAIGAALAQERSALAGGSVGGLARNAGFVVGGGLLAYDAIKRASDPDTKMGWGTVAEMAASGAMFGSMFGPWGTLAGAVIGGVAGTGMKLSGMAEGGTTLSPGLTWVGERGPELVHLPAGAQVTPHRESMAMAGGAGMEAIAAAIADLAAAPRTMTVQVTGRAYDERELARHLDAMSRRAAMTNTRTTRPIR